MVIRKILLVMPEYSSFYPMIKQSLKEMGIGYSLHDYRKTTFLEKLVQILSVLSPGFKLLKLQLQNSRLIRKTKQYRPDLVLIIKGENLFLNTIEAIKKISPVINWFPDFIQDYPNIQKQFNFYTAVFTGDKSEVDLYRGKGIKNIFHLPWAGLKISQIPKKKKYDVVFIGAYNPKREKMFTILKELNFVIWGTKGWAKSSLKDHYQGSWITVKETLNILKHSKIVVNLHQNKSPRNSLVNLRVYEATACQALLITDYWSDMDTMYKIGKEIIIYKNSRDLLNKVKYYLGNEKSRQAIALAGYKRTFKDHTYVNRFLKMERILRNQRLLF